MGLLITGINGLIGTILRNALQQTHTVYGLDREGEFSDQVLSADISDYQQVARVVQQFNPLDAIIHLAGDPRVDASWESVLKSNIIGTRNIFEAAREFQVPKVIYASSNHVTGAYHGFEPSLHKYTQPGPPMISPEDPIRPDSDYGLSKAFGEAVARYYFDRWGIKSICLRIGAVLKSDDPSKQPQNRRIWLSHRDLVQLVEKSLSTEVTFGIYYGISNNKDAFWDISNARADLSFEPVDDGSAR
jgi:nucleoside-diphosphate-sugar epimerase